MRLEHLVQARLGLLERPSSPHLHLALMADVGPGLKLRVHSQYAHRVEVGAGHEHWVQARLGLLCVIAHTAKWAWAEIGMSKNGRTQTECSRAMPRSLMSCLTLAPCWKSVPVVFVARIIAFYAELFDEGCSLECGFCRFFRAHYRVL